MAKGEIMKKILQYVPKYAIIPTLVLFLFQAIGYYGSQLINKNLQAYDLTIPWFDNLIPFISFFIVFYILSYPWWIISPIIVANTNPRRYYNWTFALIICYVICGIIYIVLPTTITRPTFEIKNIFDWMTNFIYLNDNPDRAINLFPSFHCLISWFCYLGFRNQLNMKKSYRIFALVFAILICLSTQFVKQHYIVDLISGIILAEVVFFIVNKYDLGRFLQKIYERGKS